MLECPNNNFLEFMEKNNLKQSLIKYSKKPRNFRKSSEYNQNTELQQFIQINFTIQRRSS